MRRFLFLILLLLAGAPASAISTYKGLQPGKSTRADVERTLGQAVRAVNATLFEYALTDGPGSILVEFRADGVVDRIERRFLKPISRAAIIRSLGLPDTPEEQGTNRDGKLVEYFGDVKTLALTYASGEARSGVISVGYYSMESFESGLAKARNPTVQFDPATCRDLYFWAQAERDAAKRAKNVGRHQAALEIQILSQRGECAKARDLATKYKEAYR
jgi:hypothetical protein